VKNRIISVGGIFIFTILSISGCAAVNSDRSRLSALTSLSAIDAEIIAVMTKENKGSGTKDYEGISGRVLELLLVAYQEMSNKYSDRCESEPLTRHLFFYKEKGDVIYVQTVPRFVPNDQSISSSPPHGYRSVPTQDLFPNLPVGTYGLDGCEIRFAIDVNTKKLISTQIIR
jgi:hypothetical protein